MNMKIIQMKVDRTNFTKLRISNHFLEIEKAGRHQRPYVKLKDRVCQTCKLKIGDDEAQFVLRCPSYQVLRDFIRESEVKR